MVGHMVLADFSLRKIGRELGRDHTSISREIARNRPIYADDAVYWYDAAEHSAKERRHKARHRRKQHERLVAYVTTKLNLDWLSALAIAAGDAFLTAFLKGECAAALRAYLR
jgi:IS30 family transposase